jgi:hypothetical protein
MKTNIRSVPPSGNFESDKRKMVVSTDFLDILATMPLNQKFIRKNVIFKAQNDVDLLAEFEENRIRFFNEIGLKRNPTVIINFDIPKCLPDLALATLTKIMKSFSEKEPTAIWTTSKSSGEQYLLEMILEIE